MKNLHRSKALDSYAGARVVLKEGLIYPSYVLLKESTRSILAYINEDLQNKVYSEKTKMRTLLTDLPLNVVENYNTDVFNIFVDMDSSGLESILSLELERLLEIKRVLKQLIGLYLDVHI